MGQVGWGGMTLLSLMVAAFGLHHAIGALAKLPEGADFAFILIPHVILVALALGLGPWQFAKSIRWRWLKLHRRIGRAYVLFCLAGGVSGLILAWLTVESGVARAGFTALALAWLFATSLGFVQARRRAFAAHRRWMIRSFALTFSAVILRLFLPAMVALGWEFSTAQQLGAWICWLPNLLIAELIIAQGVRDQAAIECEISSSESSGITGASN